MSPEQRAVLESRISGLVSQGDYPAAAEVILRGYGPEVLGWLISVTGHPDPATEVFSGFVEDLWRGLPRYRGAASARTWTYTLARNAWHRHHRDPYRRRAADLGPSPVSHVEQEVRASTVPYLRTEVKDGFARLRDELDPEDRALLVLRVDRDMAWNDIAAVLAGEEADLEADDVRRRAAALRKRFERVKERLRQRALETGLIARDG